ncbi:MAG TPA: hypothetical protein VFX16_03500 [Pseudonocardiaceae bacterium]|nr:hypothetical protein [Pseudonocardiaceae bacterium]
MRREDTVLFAVLAVGCFGVPIALGVALHWPIALWVLLVFVALAATGFAARHTRFRREQQLLLTQEEDDRAEPTVVEEPVDEGRRMVAVPLPCAEPGYRFAFSATVFWRPAPNPVGMRHTNPEALALESIRARASQITSDQAPGDHVAVGYQLAAALGTVLPDGSGQVVAWATDVQLSIPDDDDARLHKVTELRKHEQVWEHERGLERTMRAYLRDEVLDSPGSAVVWWLARHPDQVEDTARLIGPLAQLSAAAHGTPVHELFRDLVPQQVSTPGTPALDAAPDGADTARAIADELDSTGRPDLAGRIRNTFGVPRLDR